MYPPPHMAVRGQLHPAVVTTLPSQTGESPFHTEHLPKKPLSLSPLHLVRTRQTQRSKAFVFPGDGGEHRGSERLTCPRPQASGRSGSTGRFSSDGPGLAIVGPSPSPAAQASQVLSASPLQTPLSPLAPPAWEEPSPPTAPREGPGTRDLRAEPSRPRECPTAASATGQRTQGLGTSARSITQIPSPEFHNRGRWFP